MDECILQTTYRFAQCFGIMPEHLCCGDRADASLRGAVQVIQPYLSVVQDLFCPGTFQQIAPRNDRLRTMQQLFFLPV
ncbi:hypothetical protein D3C80_1433250 [compost metagenome]